MSDYLQATAKKTQDDPLLQTAANVQQQAAPRQHVGTSWLDAYGQQGQKSWSDYYDQYRKQFGEQRPGGYQTPSEGDGGAWSGVADQFYKNFQRRQAEAERQALEERFNRTFDQQQGFMDRQLDMQDQYQQWVQNYQSAQAQAERDYNNWMRDYYGQQAEAASTQQEWLQGYYDRQFEAEQNMLREMMRQGSYAHGVHGDLAKWANENNFEGRADWSPQEVEHLFRSSWRDPYQVAHELGISGYGDYGVHTQLAEYANRSGEYENRTNWTPQEVQRLFAGSGRDPYAVAAQLGLGSAAHSGPAASVATPTVFTHLAMYANQFGDFENRTNWTPQEVQQLFAGSGRDPLQIAAELGIPGYHSPSTSLVSGAVPGNLSNPMYVAAIGRELDALAQWANAQQGGYLGKTNWNRQGIVELLRDHPDIDPAALAREMGLV